MSAAEAGADDDPARGGRLARRAAVLALVGAAGLSLAGRFRGALALTLGAAVSIVGALWLADLAGRLRPSPGRSAAGFDWKFAVKSVLRYALAGVALFWGVTSFPAEVPWLLAGVSVTVVAAAADGFRSGGDATRGSGPDRMDGS